MSYHYSVSGVKSRFSPGDLKFYMPRVRAGASLLDLYRPGWRHELGEEGLVVGLLFWNRSILELLFIDEDEGKKQTLPIAAERRKYGAPEERRILWDHGFEPVGLDRASARRLSRAWALYLLDPWCDEDWEADSRPASLS